jgi:putative oxidoreductase
MMVRHAQAMSADGCPVCSRNETLTQLAFHEEPIYSEARRPFVFSRSEDWALLMGRLFAAALFLPSGINKLLAFSAFAASLGTKGVPYPAVVAGIMVAAEVLESLALIIGLWPRSTALILIGLTAVSIWMAHRTLGLGVVLRPQQYAEVYESLAIIGGLLFYFVSGPGGWSRTRLRAG